jgi:serine/threonine-protein kinase
MGRVWVADHRTLKVEVAVKFLAERVERVPEAVARFTVEAEAAARIKSPHVVQIFDHGFSDGTPYIVMELLEGEDLSAKLEREGRLATSETISVVSQVCKALEKAHAMGIVHRDIKPANVFLVSGLGETFVKVLDFGLAKHSGDGLKGMTGSDAIFGTPHYVSPEQADSAREVTPQSDLWSIAVVAYECLTGARPFEAASLIRLCVALNEGRFTPATTVCPELPPSVDAFFARAFERDPLRRFGSAAELAVTFAEALAGVPEKLAPSVAKAPAPVNTDHGWSGTLRRPGTSFTRARWVTAGVGVLCVGGLILLTMYPRAPSATGAVAALPSQMVATGTSASAVAPGAPREVQPATVPAAEPIVLASSASTATPVQRPSSRAPSSPTPVRAALPPTRPSAAPVAPAHELFSDPKN